MYLTLNTPQLNINAQQEGAFGLQLGTPQGLSRQIIVEGTVITNLSIAPVVTPALVIPVTGSNNVASVVIDNIVYQVSESVEVSQLAPNEFIFNPYTQEITIKQYSEPSYIEIASTSSPSPVTVSIANYSSVETVYIGNESYTVLPESTPIEELTEGQAVYNSTTNELTFTPSQTATTALAIAPQILSVQISGTQVTPSPIPIKVSVVGSSNNDGYDTDYIDQLPTVLKWLPLLGEFSYSTSLEQSQNGQIRFETWFSYKNLVLKHLCKGVKFEAFGIGWRVEGLRVTEKMRSEFPHPKLEVSVSLTDPHWWLDTEVPLVLKAGNSDNEEGLDPECATNNPTQPSSKISEYRSLSWLCSQAKGKLSGMNGKIPVPTDISPEEGRIPRSEIQARLRQNGCFLDLTDVNTVYCKKWAATKEWTLQEPAILSEISVSCSTGKQRSLEQTSVFQQEIVCGLPDTITPPQSIDLRDENTSNIYGSYYIWPKQEVTGQFLEKEQEQPEETQGNRPALLPEYRLRQRKIETKIQDPDNASTAPASVPTNDLSVAFWKAGQNFVKTKREVQTIDGFDLIVREQKYGFIGPVATDVFSFNEGVWSLNKVDVRNFWGVIEDTTTLSYYSDGQSAYEGLFLGYIKTGWRMHVFKVEPDINTGDAEAYPEDQYPTLQIEQHYYDLGGDLGEADSQSYALAQKAYKPQPISLAEEVRYYHEPMADYYKDAPTQNVDEIKICLPDGTSERIAVVDRTFQQAYIVTAESKFVASLASMDDPRNPTIREYNNIPGVDKKAEFPPLSTGTDSFEYKRIKINRSLNTPGIRYADDSDKDTYTAYSRSASTGGSGGGFISQISESRTEDFDGRPETSRRLPPIWERVEDEDKAKTEEEQNSKDPKRYRYKVWTPSAPDKTTFDQLVSGSMSFPYAETLAEVRQAIQLTIDMENTRNSYTESFTTFFNSQMRPGDKLTYFVNGERRKRRILSISPSVVFQGELNGKSFATGTMQITVGFCPEIPFVLQKELVPINEAEKNKQGSGAPLEVWLDPLFVDQGSVPDYMPSRLRPPDGYLG